jgi:hypothetical protein
MGEVLTLVRPTPEDRRRRLDLRQELRLRIHLRARQLAAIDQAGHFRSMLVELELGRLDEDDIESWEPVRGTSPILERLYNQIRSKGT